MMDLLDFLILQVPFVVMFLFRKRILFGLLAMAIEMLPREATANWIEEAMGAYITKEEVEVSKGTIAVKYVATPRLKAMAEVVAPVILAAVMAQLRKIKVDPAQLAATAKAGGLDLGQLAGQFLGGGGGKKQGGLEGMIGQFLPMILGGGGQGQAPAQQVAAKPGGPPG